jgi:ABC-type sugar transport system permease subunit
MAEESKPQQNARPKESPTESGWATCFKICGWVFTIPAILYLLVLIIVPLMKLLGLASARENKTEGNTETVNALYAMVFLVVGLQCFFSAFVVNVLTDIRWYIRRLWQSSEVNLASQSINAPAAQIAHKAKRYWLLLILCGIALLLITIAISSEYFHKHN